MTVHEILDKPKRLLDLFIFVPQQNSVPWISGPPGPFTPSLVGSSVILICNCRRTGDNKEKNVQIVYTSEEMRAGNKYDNKFLISSNNFIFF